MKKTTTKEKVLTGILLTGFVIAVLYTVSWFMLHPNQMGMTN